MKNSAGPKIPSVPLGMLKLHSITHYRQGFGIHPTPVEIPPFYDRVELMTEGRGWVEHLGEWIEVLPGDLLWHKPGEHTIGRSDFRNPYHCLAVNFVTPHQKGLGMPRFSRWAEIEDVRTFARETEQLFLNEDFDRIALRDYVLSRLILKVRLHAAESTRDKMPNALRLVVNHIEHNYATPCGMEEMTSLAGWSAAHLHGVFQRHMHTTPHKMLVRRRLRAAKERLTATNEPIKQIALECGFTDAAAFSNVFKGNLGMTPGEYRSRHMRLTDI